MAANFEIEYTADGIATVKEKRFTVQKPIIEHEREDGRQWAAELAKAVLRRRELERQLHAAEREAITAERFNRLATEWNNETAHYSVSFKRSMHSAYQQIIGMGEKALPHIFRRLRDDPGRDWFWALKAITGEDAAANETGVESAIQAWLRWAERHNM